MATPKMIIQKANAFQLKPGNSYILHVPEASPEEADQLKAWLAERGINDAIVVMTEQFNVVEKQNV